MPRQKLSEFRAKVLVNEAVGASYVGWSIQTGQNTKHIKGFDKYVVKVDQAVKGRYKKGLVLLEVPQSVVASGVKKLGEMGFTSFIVEPYFAHSALDEQYMSITQGAGGLRLLHSKTGGIDVENAGNTVSYDISSVKGIKAAASVSGLSLGQLESLVNLFKEHHFVSLEINPYVVDEKGVMILDAAVEVDDAGQYFTQSWSQSDLRMVPRKHKLTREEELVGILNANSPASFNLTVLNPNGAIFLLLSGGGASIVVADEIHNHGFGPLIANYGEYSGNPAADETYLYTKQLLGLVTASKADKKVLFIGGAVANFTDVAATFAGIIRAFDEQSDILAGQNLNVFVRRGGPNQQLGLRNIREMLNEHGILGGVYGPDVSIGKAVGVMVEELKNG